MKVGIQLFSVKNYMAKDALGTIRKVIDSGYRYLEGANHMADKDYGIGFGVSADDLKKILDDTGAKVISCHYMPLSLDTIGPILEYQEKIGTKYIVDPAAFFECRDDVLRKAELCNKLGEKCKEAGMQFLYHNHFHEFHKFDGECAMDTLLANTDEENVGLELDTFWVMRGNADPIEFMKKYKGRIKLVHQKDYTKGMEDQMDAFKLLEGSDKIDFDAFMKVNDDRVFAEIGTGIMNIQEIIDTANEYCKSEYIVLEQDATLKDELESISISMEQFKKFSGIQW